ncbi:MAG: GxxExxY protein [Chitinophagaceae bacterium]|nr:GxxExxY protein [Chitinophagaceae bacterium]
MILLLKEEVYRIVGYCIEVWKTLGYGFSEVIYKDAMEVDFIEDGLTFVREEELHVYYKGKTLRHKFKADFTLFGSIIVEVKAGEEGINNAVISQTLNYLKASGCRVGLIINFGRSKMEYKRLIV